MKTLKFYALMCLVLLIPLSVSALPAKINKPRQKVEKVVVDTLTKAQSPCSKAINAYSTDKDGDGIPDSKDNCPTVANPQQNDTDGNGVGDACEPKADPGKNDKDGDGVVDADDKCPDIYNPKQDDLCSDPKQSVDYDGDGIPDVIDNCPYNYNPNQHVEPCHLDKNDIDGDGIPNESDICPTVYNPDQKADDADKDGIPDACDLCPTAFNPVGDPHFYDSKTGKIIDTDGDGIPDACDNCPEVFNSMQKDKNMDGVGDACDHESSDMDEDGISDVNDLCPNVYNPKDDPKYYDQATGDPIDTDGDGIPDACDACPTTKQDKKDPTLFDQVTGQAIDDDGDGIPNACDNCPTVYNPCQKVDEKGQPIACSEDPAVKDSDEDGIPDKYENPYCAQSYNPKDDPKYYNQVTGEAIDTDGDGVPDACDNCPLDSNPDQANVCGIKTEEKNIYYDEILIQQVGKVIELKSKDISTVEVWNQLGIQVLSQKGENGTDKVSVSIANLASGVYIFNIKTKKSSTVKKIIIAQ